MIRIPSDVILIWTGTNASIPTGWTRETSLDGKYPKAWGSENPNTTGGAATHTHTSPTHTHTVTAHTHSYTIPQITNNQDYTKNQIGGEAVDQHHTHSGTAPANTSASTGATAVTYGACSNDPPYHAVIFIKAQAGAILRDNIVALWSGATLPTNWNQCDGNNSTPDLRNKYLKGAAAGADAGATGGAYANVHDISHTHTGASHSHGASTSSATINSYTMHQGSGSCCSVAEHTHSVNATDAATATPDAYSSSLTTSETVEPAYKKLMAMMRAAGGQAKKGLIALWLGTVASIPPGWIICDGNNGTPDMRDKFLKVASNAGEINATGGANTHTHAAQSHTHSGGYHRHLINQTIYHYSIRRVDLTSEAGNYDDLIDSMYHSPFYTAYATPGFDAANTTGDSSANQPEYRTAVYIYLRTPRDPRPRVVEV